MLERVDYLSITLGTRGYYVKDVTHAGGACRARGTHHSRRVRLPIIVGQRINNPKLRNGCSRKAMRI